MPDRDPEAFRALLKPTAVRERAQEMLELGLAGQLLHFSVHPARLEACADYVLETIRANYPTLDIPFHARWRHFVAEGEDRWQTLDREANFADPAARGRAAYDLAVVSVLLDAGAGPDWRYRDAATGREIGRSEGLALASLDMFAAGLFSSDPAKPLQADAAGLKRLDAAALARGFQAGRTTRCSRWKVAPRCSTASARSSKSRACRGPARCSTASPLPPRPARCGRRICWARCSAPSAASGHRA